MKHFINLKDIPARDLRKILIDAKKRKKARNKLDNDFPKRVSEYWESISSRGAFLEAQKRNE